MWIPPGEFSPRSVTTPKYSHTPATHPTRPPKKAASTLKPVSHSPLRTNCVLQKHTRSLVSSLADRRREAHPLPELQRVTLEQQSLSQGRSAHSNITNGMVRELRHAQRPEHTRGFEGPRFAPGCRAAKPCVRSSPT